MAFVGAFLSMYVDLVLRPHPGFDQSGRVATIGQTLQDALIGLPYEIVERISGEMTSIEAAAMVRTATPLIGPEDESVTAETVSRAFFGDLRPRLALGRGFRQEDHTSEAEPVAVISYRMWRERFNANPNILGTFVELSHDPSMGYSGPPSTGLVFSNAEPEEESADFRIVGVMTQDLTGVRSQNVDLWLPIERAFPVFTGVFERLREAEGLALVRLRPGVSVEAVASELSSRYRGSDSLLNRIPGTRLDAIEGIVRNIAVQRDAKRQLELFLAGSVLLALVAAANVSLFLLARAPGRRRELSIRMAVGAPIGRIARQLATEAGLLAVVSAVLGLLGSFWLSLWLRSLTILRQAEWHDVTLLDWRVLCLAGAFVLALTLLVSLVPVFGLRRLGIAASSRETMARASVAQRLVGTGQIAVAGAFGGAAIAFGWYLSALMFGNAGYETANRYVADGVTNLIGLNRDQIFVEFSRRRETIEAIPGVTAVAFGGPVPGAQSGNSIPLPVRIQDPADPAHVVEAYAGTVESRFIDLLGLNLIHGRAPEYGETAGVLVNQALARALWGRDDVVGERLPGDFRWGLEGADIVGVLEDLSFGHPSATVPPFVYSTLGSPAAIRMTTVIEAQLTAAELQQELNRIGSTGALEVEVQNIRSLRQLRYELVAQDRVRSSMTITTATLVVLLAGFGFYGTQRYLVAAGRREYAIRASLGAGPSALGRLVLFRGLLLGTPGLVTGGLLAYIAVAWLRDDFISPEIAPSLVTIWVLAGLTFILLVASLGPAREARRTQPAPLLRED
jgi:ABC-type antimicrobial peptide transport system permease subunit